MLQEQVVGHGVLMVPLLDLLLLIIYRLVRVSRSGGSESAIEMRPMLSSLHCFMEVHGEDGPV